jgi:hypothetical protein
VTILDAHPMKLATLAATSLLLAVLVRTVTSNGALLESVSMDLERQQLLRCSPNRRVTTLDALQMLHATPAAMSLPHAVLARTATSNGALLESVCMDLKRQWSPRWSPNSHVITSDAHPTKPATLVAMSLLLVVLVHTVTSNGALLANASMDLPRLLF